MNSSLSVWKNIIWIVGVAICLVAVLAGFITAAFGNAGFYTEENMASGDTMDQSQQSTAELLTVPESADGGQAYLESLQFLVDSSLIGLRDYSLTGMYQVWGSNAGNIPAASIADPTIRYPVDGSEVSVLAAVSAVQPKVLIISLGMDGINATNEADFIANYTSLVNSVKTQSPGTKIALCSLCSVTGAYAGTDGMSSAQAQTVEGWVQTVAKNTGVWFVDVAAAVTDSGGTLFNDYAGANAKSVNSAGCSKVLEYLRCHVIP